MPSYAPHPLEAKFIKLALLQQIVTPIQVKRCQDALAERIARGQVDVSLEQVLQEEGLITEDECEQIWAQIARSGDTEVRNQVADKLGTRAGDEPPEQAAAAHTVDLKKIPKRLGDYEIIEPIGRGGMGMVYKARQVQMERYVALKLLPPELASNAKYIRRFIREARAAGALNHGNLVHVHDVGEAAGRYFISMELVEGHTVKQIMRREGRVGVLETLKIAEQVCAALDCAHKHKVVHRDIKPDNIMLTDLGIAKLCDLGLAKMLEGGPLQDTDTQDGHAMGTPHYMSPEQARSSGKVDARTDLYSLGATLYHMLTGRVPFDGDTPIEVLMRVTNEPPVRPDRYEPLLPPPLTSLVLRLLAKNPEDRPTSAEAVRKEIHQLRRDIETGRVFVFDDLPLGLKIGKPVPTPPKKEDAPWRKWALGVAAALGFMGLCAAGSRDGRGASRAPAPEYASFTAPRTLGHSETTAPEAVQAGVTPRASKTLPQTLALDPENRTALEKRLADNPDSWPAVLAGLETLNAPELAATSGEEQARWADLKALALKLRDQAFERDLSRRISGAAALAEAGRFKRAAELLENLPPHARASDALKEKARAAAADIAAKVKADTNARTAEIESLAKAGLLRAAWQECQQWAQELEADGLPTARSGPAIDERVQTWQTASEGVRQASLRALAEEDANAKALDTAVSSVARTRAFTSKNDLEGARKQAEALLQHAATDSERCALSFELERIRLVKELYAQVAKGIADRPGRIKESDFRNDARISGRVKSMDADHLMIIADPGVQALVPLANLARSEMRALISHVMLKEEIVPDNLLGRLAFDLEDRNDTGIRLLLIDLAAKDESAAQLLNKLMACDGPWLKNQARELMGRAEEKFVQGKFLECQRLDAAALSTVGGIGDTALEARGQRLLELAATARASGDLLHASCLPQARGRMKAFYSATDLSGRISDWLWQGPAPSPNSEGALAFGGKAAKTAPAWKLEAPGLVELDAFVPPDGMGALTLLAAPVDALNVAEAKKDTWMLRLDAGNEGTAAALTHPGEPAPPWASAALPFARHQRLWLRFDVGVVRWGVEDRELGQRDTAPSALWRIELRADGNINLYGVQAEGRLDSGRTREQRERDGAQALAQALKETGDARARLLKEVVDDYGAYARLVSRACAELAAFYRSGRHGAETRYWESRALFECPSAQWPLETQVLLADHRLWLNTRDRLGPTATDALRFGRVDAYNQPSLTVGDPQKPAPKENAPADNNEPPAPAPPKKTDGKVEDEEPDKKASEMRKLIIRLARDGKWANQDGKEPALGLTPPAAP
ncbi:MAG: serine/threonine protein kinase [Planctomycetes bacterium]|nr:serine/threonine protein kinase [Planctomycetota bacterium]